MLFSHFKVITELGSFLLCYGASLCSVILDLTDAHAICGFIFLETAYNYYSKRKTEVTNLKEFKFLELNLYVRPKSRFAKKSS